MKFSAKERKNILKEISSKEFDLLVIGGGITGAGIALDAASRGLNVALVEKNDFASGTSSRSTKLVHGGLRYLEHLELGLVKEVGREREIVHKNASHIVLPEKMILPIVENGSLGDFTTSLALYVYDFLAGVKKEEHRKMLTREETIEKEPLIDSPQLKSGALYYEYKTDDSRLTIEVLKKASEYGSLAINYVEVTDFIYENNFVKGVKVLDKINYETYSFKAKYIVNATGAWVDKMREKDNSLKGKRLHHTKGIHIVIPKSKFKLKHAIYFDVGDNRMIFAIPRFNVVYIGTTDTSYSGNLDNPDITREDVQYLLNATNKIAPTAKLTIDDVEVAWSGLRPLIHEDGKDPSELSRKDEIFYSDSGLISIAGGKLTGYRMMSKKVVDLIRTRFKQDYNRSIGKCITKDIRLSGGEFKFDYSLRKLVEYADKKFDEAKQTGISKENFKHLFYRYGNNIDILTEKAFYLYNQTKNSKSSWLNAEIIYCIENEMTTNLSDFFIRRTGMIFFYVNEIQPIFNLVADEMADILNWTELEKNKNIADFQLELKNAISFK
jgi:glycerol-3-phosphate dehydrogenase